MLIIPRRLFCLILLLPVFCPLFAEIEQSWIEKSGIEKSPDTSNTARPNNNAFGSLSMGGEFNGFSLQLGSTAVNLSVFPLENRIAQAGIRGSAIYDFGDTTGFDIVWVFRFYVLNFKRFQLLLGVEQGMSYLEAPSFLTLFTISSNASVAARIFLSNSFFLEPYIRGGYPVVFAAGISAGFKWDYRKS
jgi:hypothetical protein